MIREGCRSELGALVKDEGDDDLCWMMLDLMSGMIIDDDSYL